MTTIIGNLRVSLSKSGHRTHFTVPSWYLVHRRHPEVSLLFLQGPSNSVSSLGTVTLRSYMMLSNLRSALIRPLAKIRYQTFTARKVRKKNTTEGPRGKALLGLMFPWSKPNTSSFSLSCPFGPYFSRHCHVCVIGVWSHPWASPLRWLQAGTSVPEMPSGFT